MQAGSGGGGMPTQQQIMEAKQKEAQQEEMRSELLKKILTADAQERIKRIGIVKPEKARQVEDHLLAQAKNGIKQPYTEDQVKGLLESLADHGASTKATIQFDRRRFGDDSDSDIDLEGL